MVAAVVVSVLMVAQAGSDKPSPSAMELVSVLETVMADAIAQAEPSVVAIARVKGEDEETTAVRGRHPTRPPEPEADLGPFLQPRVEPDDPIKNDFLSYDYGSGVVIGEKNQILTAFHVVKGASRIPVRAAGAPGFFYAEIIAADPRSDLAVLVPREDPRYPVPKLKPIALGDATKLRKGSFLIALGNPFNAARHGGPSASWGILANTARRIEPSPEEVQFNIHHLRHYPTLLQLDAKLNLGMSGGAVVNLKGELVGITTSASSASGFDAQAGYAIPIDPLTRRVISALKEGKEAEYGFLGIGLNANKTNMVSNVLRGTPAEQGGLVVNDVIIEVDGERIENGDDLILAVNRAPVGRPLKLKVLRTDHDSGSLGGRVLEKTVIVSKAPVQGEVIATNRPRPWRGVRVDYSSALPFVGPISEQVLEAMSKGGVGVVEVAPGSPAEAAGLKRGQIITAVEDQAVHNPAQFAQAVAGRKGAVMLMTDLGPVTVK
jgi:serine protease Do